MDVNSNRTDRTSARRPIHSKVQSGSTSHEHLHASLDPMARQVMEQRVQLAIQSLRGGRLQEAESSLGQVLAQHPRHALAHNCMGVVMRSTGRLREAIAHYQSAIECNPGYAEAYNNLGIVLEAVGRLDEAADSYRSSLHERPEFAAARNNFGNALTKLGRYTEALTHFGKAIEIQPEFAAAHNNRGLALREMGRVEEAEESYRRAIQYHPTFAQAYVNLGNLYVDGGRWELAMECFRLALRSTPKLASAHLGLGNALLSQSRPNEAAECYLRASQFEPRMADAHFGLGKARKEMGDLREAVASYQKAIALKPRFVEALNNLGNAYASLGEMDQAIETFQAAVADRPDYLPAHNNLGNLYRMQERFEDAAASYREVLLRQPDSILGELRLSTLCPTVFPTRQAMDDYFSSTLDRWISLEGCGSYQDLPDLLAVANEPPFNLQFFADNIRPHKEAYARIFQYNGPEVEMWEPHDRIRIGMVVTAQHEIAFLRLIWDALDRMNKDEFDLTIISTDQAVSKFRGSIARGSANLFPIPNQPDHIVSAIRDAQFDLLYYFEVGTDAINYFLPFFRLAPVQCTSWGIQVTSGIPNIDYYLSSNLVEPDEAQEHYSERLICGDTLLAYQIPISLTVPTKSRAAFGFERSDHLYVCAQHLGKFHHDFDPVLADILREDPDGRLVITEDRYGYGAAVLRQRFHDVFPDIAHRVVFVPRQALPDYNALISHADVHLDPTHFGGVNTTYDALALDRPLVTMPTRMHRGRYTAGCLRRMGMEELIVEDTARYVQKAVALGTDADYRRYVSERIRESKTEIFWDQEAVHEHEHIFRTLVNEASQ